MRKNILLDLVFCNLAGAFASSASHLIDDVLRYAVDDWVESSPYRGRLLQRSNTSNGNAPAADSNSKACHICGIAEGLDLLEDAKITTPIGYAGFTCLELEEFLSTDITSDSTLCLASQSHLVFPCCNATNTAKRLPTYLCEDKVHKDIINAANYNPDVIPVPSDRPLDITLHLEYFHLTSLSTDEGTTEIYVRMRTDWIDERLRWDPAEFGGCSETTVRASLDRELTDIWVPTVDLLNRVSGVSQHDEAPAYIYANGRVTWQRLGPLKAFCSFWGLESFPFDTLGCVFRIGNPIEHAKLNLELGTLEVDIFNLTRVPGLLINPIRPKYQEYSLEESLVKVEEVPATQAFDYYFYFSRASRHYSIRLVAPTILFTFMSFGMFFLDQRHGERLAYGVTFLLVLIAQGLLTSDFIPRCNEVLWAYRLTNVSYCWTAAAITESIISAALFWADVNEKEENETKSRNENHTLANTDQLDEAQQCHDTNSRKSKNVTSKPSKLKVIRTMDRVCMIIFPLSYLIFISIMLSQRGKW